MRISRPLAGLVVSVALFGAALHAQRASQPAAQPTFDPNDLPPISYVCNSPGEENVIDDKPGTCPKSHAPLVRVRLDTAYKCLRGPADIQAKPAAPCYANAERGPVTVSVFWFCSSKADDHFLEPGKCDDGSGRQEGFQERPHGDHNPRHGGLSIFMSKDLWHHVEGTLVASGTTAVFRAYFYNEFTKPVPPGVFSASVAVANSNNVETGMRIQMTVAKTPDGNALEARIPNLPMPTTTSQVYLKLHVKFKSTDVEDWPTDYQFPAYSKEPPGGTAAPSSTGASAKPPVAPARGGTQTAAASGARPPIPTPKPPAVKPPAAKPVAPKPAPAPVESPTGGAMAGSSSPDLSGAGFAAQAILPDTTPELLALLKTKRDEVQKGLDDGQLGGVWLPALDAKDVAIALEENHSRDLPDGKRPSLSAAVKQITVTAWQIDAAGDLGNKDKLLDLNKVFSAAADDIESLYASK